MATNSHVEREKSNRRLLEPRSTAFLDIQHMCREPANQLLDHVVKSR
jgi:hypothetical protein